MWGVIHVVHKGRLLLWPHIYICIARLTIYSKAHSIFTYYSIDTRVRHILTLARLIYIVCPRSPNNFNFSTIIYIMPIYKFKFLNMLLLYLTSFGTYFK